MSRAHLAIAVAATILLAACGSDSDSAPFGTGRQSAPDSIEPATPPTEEPPTATAPSDESSTTAATTGNGDPSTPATDAAAGPLSVPAVALFEIGSFERPVDVAFHPVGGEIHVVEQPGRVVAVSDLSADIVLDITDLTEATGEQGLLGLAFHPTADLAYVNFTDTNGDTVVAEFAIEATGGRFDRESYREVLTIEQPYGNHNGGQLAFGPDQLLYVGVGDGGSGGDPQRYALDLTSRLGKILRIDPIATDGEPFTVPDDNPFVGTTGADPTIWAYGLRNPWRFSFDPPTGDLWIGDVGQVRFEEINHSRATDRRNAARGANFGWSAFEGFERFNDDQVADGAEEPLFVYDHIDGRCSVTGGTVARGDIVVDLAGWYLFGDYCSGQIWALDPTAPAAEPRVVEIAQLDAVVGFTEAPDGEMYAISNAGSVVRFMAG